MQRRKTKVDGQNCVRRCRDRKTVWEREIAQFIRKATSQWLPLSAAQAAKLKRVDPDDTATIKPGALCAYMIGGRMFRGICRRLILTNAVRARRTPVWVIFDRLAVNIERVAAIPEPAAPPPAPCPRPAPAARPRARLEPDEDELQQLQDTPQRTKPERMVTGIVIPSPFSYSPCSSQSIRALKASQRP